MELLQKRLGKIYPYNKITGCVCVCVSLYRRISLTAESILFSFTGYFAQILGRFIARRSYHHPPAPRKKIPLPQIKKNLKQKLGLLVQPPPPLLKYPQRLRGGVAASICILEQKLWIQSYFLCGKGWTLIFRTTRLRFNMWSHFVSLQMRERIYKTVSLI